MNNNFVDKNELAIAWIDLSYVQTSIFCGPTKHILQSLNGQINFHTLTALMGPSGAGKTTLLKCINMRNNTGLTNNTKLFVNKYTPLKTCFIMQNIDEHLFMGLTVRESLLFASKIKNRNPSGIQYRDSCTQTGGSSLRLRGCVREEEHISTHSSYDCEPIDKNGNFDHEVNVNKILSELLLVDCAHNLVKACSGGEQKRLTVGLELVQQNKPNLLCIDEPTSGLDSNAAELVVQCLSQLTARHPMAIITSIHQPNSLLLSMFDQLYVLSKGGHCVFTGRPNHLRRHLQACGITCGEDVLSIEMMLKVSSKTPNNRSKQINSNKKNCNHLDESTQSLAVEDNEIDRLINYSLISSAHISQDCRICGKLVSNKVTEEYKSFNCYHFYYLLLRGFTSIMRYEWRVTAAMFTFMFTIALFLIYLYGSDVGVEDGCVVISSNQTTNASLPDSLKTLHEKETKVALNLKLQFFTIVFMEFIAMAYTVLTFPSEVRIFLSEHKNKWYSSGSYYWSKCIIEVPITVTVSLNYCFIIYYGTGQLDNAFRFTYFTLIATCGMIIGNSAGHLIGVIFAHNYQVATTAMVAFFLVLALLSGFFMPLSTQNIYIRGFSYMSFVRLTFEPVLITIYSLDRCEDTEMSLILHQLNLTDRKLSEYSFWILGHTVFWRLLALFALIYKANNYDFMSVFKRKQTLESIEANDESNGITFCHRVMKKCFDCGIHRIFCKKFLIFITVIMVYLGIGWITWYLCSLF